jgi:quinol monooxygenase YgiN
MYGTVARFQVKPGALQQVQQLSREFEAALVPGFVFQHVYQMDASQDQLFLAVAFESKAAYLANADSPEQQDRYRRYRELLVAEPEWHDGEIVASDVAATADGRRRFGPI